MPYKITYMEDGGVLLDYSGKVSGMEAFGADQKIYTSTAHPIGEIRYFIVDFSNTELIDYPLDISKAAADVDLKVLSDNPNLNIVIVTGDDLIFGLTRIWQAYVPQESRTDLFRTREEADKWVKMKLGKES